MKTSSRRTFLLLGGGTVLSCLSAKGHDFTSPRHQHFFLPHVRRLPHAGSVSVKSIEVNASIDRQASLTTMVIEMQNTDSRQQEGQALLPVPKGAVLRKYTLDGVEGKFSAKLMAREEARRIYDSIVSQLKDPALLEFAGDGVVKSSVFPIPAGGTVKLEIQYECLLEQDGGRVDYYIPRSQSLDYKVPWKVKVSWKSNRGIASIYSPSHPIQLKHKSPHEAQITAAGPLQPGSFRLSLLTKENKDANATFYGFPDPQGKGGHFLMLMTPPAPDENAKKWKRELTLVIDKSGSMAGEKMDQVKAAALQVIEGLEDGEAFNVIVYNEAVESMAQAPVVKSRRSLLVAREYLKNIRVSGGTNIHGALHKSLGQASIRGYLPLVMFLTDGVPTIGETNEKSIRQMVQKNNPHKRRIFSFGVGVDVNTPLLSGISTVTRAVASYVLPKENVELKVAQVFRRLAGPVLQYPKVTVIGADGAERPGIVNDMIPNALPDMYHQDQVILLGRYEAAEKIQFQMQGKAINGEQKYRFIFDARKADVRHGFVPRLWATRKISVLVEALRDIGAQHAGGGNTLNRNDPKVKELIDEVVRLSLRYGVLSEYTAFLAKEGAPLAGGDQIRNFKMAADNIEMRALNDRVGYSSVNQEFNLKRDKDAACLNVHNSHWNAKMKKSQVAEVQQIGNKTYYRRNGSWDDVEKDTVPANTTIVELGSKGFSTLVDELLKQNEQGCLSLPGNIQVSLNGKNYLIKK